MHVVDVKVGSYGNVTTMAASLSGICVEELDVGLVAFNDSAFPVITTCIARK